MSPAPHQGPVVIDTDVFSAGLHGPSLIATAYEPLIVGRPAFISFQTVAEIRFGAALRNWGTKRILKMETRIGSAEIVHSGPARSACSRPRSSARLGDLQGRPSGEVQGDRSP